MKFRFFVATFSILFCIALNAVASDQVIRTVDSFDFLIDNSGSMLSREKTTKTSKIKLAKDVLGRLNQSLPPLGYNASMHTVTPKVEVVVPYGPWDQYQMGTAIEEYKGSSRIFGNRTAMGDGIAKLDSTYRHMKRPTAIILVSDGLNDRGYSPVREAELIMETQPGTCFHVISFADTPEGAQTLNEIASISSCSVIVDGLTLYNDDMAIIDFAEKVFYNRLSGDTLVLRGVNFAFDSTHLSNDAKAVLDEASRVLLSNLPSITLEGWTDNIGSDEYNLGLSKRRADAVKAYLVSKGIPSNRITTKGMGKSYKYNNDTPDGRFLNRRVEVMIGN